jgi:hypothetical protein
MSLALKGGVRMHGVRPEVLFAAVVVDQVYADFGQKLTVITGALNGKHLPGSSHYRGEALDFRTQDPGGAWGFDDATRAKVRAEIQSRLGDDYQVLDEGDDAQGSTAPHIHVQFRPQQPYTQ